MKSFKVGDKVLNHVHGICVITDVQETHIISNTEMYPLWNFYYNGSCDTYKGMIYCDTIKCLQLVQRIRQKDIYDKLKKALEM